MPVVPTVKGRQIESRGVQTGGFQAVQQPNMGDVLVNAGSQAIDVISQAKQQVDVALSQDAGLTLSQAGEDLKNKLYSIQGKNALGKAKEFTQQYDQQIQTLHDTLPNGIARQMFMQQAKQQRIQFDGNAARYEMGQINAFENDQYEATRKLQIQNEADAWDNPQTAIFANNERVTATARYGTARGWSDEQILSEIEKDNRTATELRAKNYAVANPLGWVNGEFSNPGGTSNGLDMKAVGIVESGGNHFSDDGKVIEGPVTKSGARAQGQYQLMPETGKELAQQMGVEYNPNDPEQHAQLANRYAGQLFKKYDSEVLAGAAYNWGQGNVDKLIAEVGDPRKGEIPQADFIKKLPSETQGWLARYNKNKTGMDPLTVYQIDNLANAQIEKQRGQHLKELMPQYNNAIAQLNNGEVPDEIPSIPSIMFGYGDQGKKMVTQLDIAMTNAKKFQAIQYHDPARQQAELASMKPQVNDPDYALKLDAYGKLTSLVQRSNEVVKDQRDSRKFNEALSVGEKLDPADKAMQKAADYTQAAQNFRIGDANTHDDIVQQVAQTGIIPSQVTSGLQGIARAKSPQVVLAGANLFSRLYESDMASVGDMPKDMQGFYLTVKQLSDAGMAPEAAVEHAQMVTYDQTDAMKKQFASTQSSREYKKEMTKAMESARSSMTQWLRIDPDIDDGSVEYKDALVGGAQFQADYQSLYDINYRAVGGNADIAKKMTNQQIARHWSISSVNGDAKFMKYAPEAEYNYGPSGWQSEQWKTDKERLMYGDREETITTSPTKLGITSGNASDVLTTTPESNIGGELEVVPDPLTVRNGDYAIMVRIKGKDGIEGIQPYYDKTGKPMRWKPSLEDWGPYQEMQKERIQREQDEQSKGQVIRGFKDKHRAIDEQYKRFHGDRVNRFKNYFSWSEE